jgi:phospholipid/cholesterol/gamma-HCH transport system permease protein
MSSLGADSATRGNPYKRSVLTDLQASSAWDRLKILGELGAMGVRVLRMIVTPPFTWWRTTITEVSLSFRRTAWPMILSHSIYMLAFGLILFGNIILSLGLPERHGGILSILWTRELATWITGMVFAGIVGSAITADLGARKIREELDALAVLGVEQTRTLIVPRVVAATVAMPALALLSLIIVNAVEWFAAPGYFGVDRTILIDGFKANILATDVLLSTALKNLILGYFIGIVACYKGVSCKAGAEGVGRAVNQTVVITFFGVWLFNSVFNFAYFTTFPDLATFRG